jgi:MFS family permease
LSKSLLTPKFLLVNLINFLVLTANSLFVLYPLFLQDIGKSKTEIGFIIGVYSMAGLFARLLSGEYMDRIGRKFFIRIGAIGLMLCAILFTLPYYENWYLLVVRVIQGAALGAFFTGMFTWAADYAPPGRTAEAVGLFGISGLLTTATGPLVGEVVLRTFGNNFSYIYLTVFLFCGAGLLMSTGMKEYFKVSIDGTHDNFTGVLKRPIVIVNSFLGIMFGIGLSAVLAFGAPYIRAYSDITTSAFFIPYTAASILIRIFFGQFADKNKTGFLVTGFILMSAGHILLGLLHTVPIIPQLGFLLGLAHGMVFPSMLATMLEAAGSNNRGRGMGIINAAIDSGHLVGASALGFIADRMSLAYMYIVSGSSVGFGLMSFLTGRFILRKKEPAEQLNLPETKTP